MKTLSFAAVALVFCASFASAQPSSIWAKAKKPTQAELDYAHERASFFYQDAESEGGPQGPRGGLAIVSLESARALLERVGAASSDDLRLRFDLARVLQRLNRYEDVIKVLVPTLALAPQHVRAEEGWFELAICDARLGKHQDEEQAYLAALELEDDPYGRSVILANLAEARMQLHHLDAAKEAAEQSIELRPDAALTHWTLAVIEDRNGNPFGALTEARVASSLDPNFDELLSPEVFFEPEYEVHWYVGLGELSHAATASTDNDTMNGMSASQMHLMHALEEFDRFVKDAPLTDPYRPRAVEHVLQIEGMLKLTPKPKPLPTPKPPKPKP